MKTEKVETFTVRNEGPCDRCGKGVIHAVQIDGKNFHAFCADRKQKEDMIRANNNQGDSNEN